jgi:hypothetical protein
VGVGVGIGEADAIGVAGITGGTGAAGTAGAGATGIVGSEKGVLSSALTTDGLPTEGDPIISSTVGFESRFFMSELCFTAVFLYGIYYIICLSYKILFNQQHVVELFSEDY